MTISDDSGLLTYPSHAHLFCTVLQKICLPAFNTTLPTGLLVILLAL